MGVGLRKILLFFNVDGNAPNDTKEIRDNYKEGCPRECEMGKIQKLITILFCIVV